MSSNATVALEAVNLTTLTTTPETAAPATGAGGGSGLAKLLLVPQLEALEKVHAQYERGSEIRDVRIRYIEDLEEARARKLSWTHQTTALLMSLFATSEVADFCNDWVGKIFPEYAEFGNFVEQFYEEMTHRLGRLHEVMLRLEQLATAAGSAVVEASPATTPAPAPAAKKAAPAAARPARATPREPQAPAPAPPAPATPKAPARVLVSIDTGSEVARQVGNLLRRLGVDTAPGGAERKMEDDIGFAVLSDEVLCGAGAAANVAFHAGWCVGRLGEERVCTLGPKAATAIGVVPHVTMDAAGGWQLDLARRLKRAGFAVDLNCLC